MVASSAMQAELIDEYQFVTHAIIAGRGKDGCAENLIPRESRSRCRGHRTTALGMVLASSLRGQTWPP